MHLEQGITEIDTPLQEQRIASMFRGCGPLGCDKDEQESFDQYLLDLCIEKGAELVTDRMEELERKGNTVLVRTKGGLEKEYDLVVGSIGLNKKAFDAFGKISPEFEPPKQTKTYKNK